MDTGSDYVEIDMKVWASRYALSKGVYEVEVKQTESPGYVAGKSWDENFFGEGRQWHHTKEEAIARAEVLPVLVIG